MKIASITLENFKSYRDKQTIEFGTDSRFITVIEGQMGHGKSNLLNAFYWCLFNQYWHSDEAKLIDVPDPNEVDLFNKGNLRDEAIHGKKINLLVEIEFWDDNENKYTVYRTHTGHYMRNTWKFEHESQLKVAKVDADTGEFNQYEGTNAEAEINRFFPKSLSNYFLFRGENRSQLVKLQGKKEFQLALGELSKIEVFKRSVRHLSSVIDIFQRESAGLMGGELQKQIDNALERKQDGEQQIEEYSEQLNDLESLLQSKIDVYNECNEKIMENEEALEFQKEKKILENDEKTIEGAHAELLIRRNHELVRFWSTLIITNVLDKVNSLYQKAVESGSYPPNIHPSVIEKVLKELRCICGRNVEKESIEYKIIERLKSSDSYDQIIRDVESLMNDVRRVQVSIEKYPEKIREYGNDARKLMDEKREKRKLIDHYTKQIGNVDISLEELLKMQREAKDGESQTNQKITEIKNLITTKERELREIDRELQDYENRMDRSELPAIKLALARKSLVEAKKLEQKFEESIYKDLEKYTQEHWSIMVYDKLNYKKIALERSYMYFDVLDSEGISRRSSMNTGHSILLVLSFISALIRIAKETWKVDFPLVLDAPLSEIGESAMPSALNSFGKVFNQAIVILKDGSIAPTASDELKGKIGKRYWIKYDENRQHSKIEEKRV